MTAYNSEFGAAVSAKLAELGWSYRAAGSYMGVSHTAVYDMARGQVPSYRMVVDFALAIHEDINKWLRLAGYRIIPSDHMGSADLPETPELPAFRPLRADTQKPSLDKQELLKSVESRLLDLHYLSEVARKEIMSLLDAQVSRQIPDTDDTQSEVPE